MSNDAEARMTTAMQEAAQWYWLIRAPDVSDVELADWQAWLAMAPENKTAFERVEGAVDAVGMIESPPWPTEEEMLADRYDGSIEVSEWLQNEGDRRTNDRRVAVPRQESGNRGFSWALAAGVAAVAVALTAYVLSMNVELRTPEVAVYQTAAAEHRDVMLPDGSSISLGARTSISVTYARDSRRIELESGEAFFDVARDPKRPFEVLASGRRMVAVGTAFNVARRAGRVTLTVTEGTVVVEPQSGASSGTSAGGNDKAMISGEIARVEAGYRVVYDRAEVDSVSFTDAEDALAWRSGVLKYRDESLRNIIEDVNRYTRQPIRIADEAAASLEFTGTVFQDRADTWVDALEAALPVTVERTANGVSIRARSQ